MTWLKFRRMGRRWRLFAKGADRIEENLWLVDEP